MRAHLKTLVGTEIETLTGARNGVLRVDAGTVLISTKKSPEGKPVDLGDLQDAADRLYRDDDIEISVANVGYRSAFIGAALMTLPGTVGQVQPRWVKLVRPE